MTGGVGFVGEGEGEGEGRRREEGEKRELSADLLHLKD
jgi:hypothetical protein